MDSGVGETCKPLFTTLAGDAAMTTSCRLRRSCDLLFVLILVGVNSTSASITVNFGSGANEFQMEFVPISPGTTPDMTGSPNPAGAVSYPFLMGKYEVSRDMITKANAAGMLGITLQDMSSFGGNGVNRPATGISWFEAAKFVNWLNADQGFNAAYKFDAGGTFQLWQSGDPGFDATNPFRNSLANYVLPSVHEWYKAAYYDPMTMTYFDFPTGSDTAPMAVAGGTTAGTAVYNQGVFQGPADIMNAGGLSPFGTMGQGGNVWEWEETEYDLVNSSVSSSRGVRGGVWVYLSNSLSSSTRRDVDPAFESNLIGFRVASLSSPANVIPEPSSLLVWSVIGMCGLWCVKRRGRK